jgi:hypothetical protein
VSCLPFPAKSSKDPSCTLPHSSNWWKSLISSQLLPSHGLQEESTRPWGGIANDFFQHWIKIRLGGRHSSYQMLMGILGSASCKFLGFFGNPALASSSISRPALGHFSPLQMHLSLLTLLLPKLCSMCPRRKKRRVWRGPEHRGEKLMQNE